MDAHQRKTSSTLTFFYLDFKSRLLSSAIIASMDATLIKHFYLDTHAGSRVSPSQGSGSITDYEYSVKGSIYATCHPGAAGMSDGG